MSFVLPLLILLSPKPFSNQSGDPSGNASAFVWQHWWWLLLVDVLFIVNLFVVLSNIVPNRIGRRTHERASYIVLYLWPWVLTIIIWVFWCLILRGAWSLGGKAETELRSKLHWLGAYSIAVIVTGGLLLILRLIIPFQGGLFTPFMRARHIYACALPSIAIVTINIMWFLTLRFIGLMNGRRVFQGDNAWTMDEFNGTLKVMGPLVAVCLVLNWASLVVYVEGTLQLYQLLSKSRDTPEAHASPDLERGFSHSNGRRYSGFPSIRDPAANPLSFRVSPPRTSPASSVAVSSASPPSSPPPSTWGGRLPTHPIDETEDSSAETFRGPEGPQRPRIFKFREIFSRGD